MGVPTTGAMWRVALTAFLSCSVPCLGEDSQGASLAQAHKGKDQYAQDYPYSAHHEGKTSISDMMFALSPVLLPPPSNTAEGTDEAAKYYYPYYVNTEQNADKYYESYYSNNADSFNKYYNPKDFNTEQNADKYYESYYLNNADNFNKYYNPKDFNNEQNADKYYESYYLNNADFNTEDSADKYYYPYYFNTEKNADIFYNSQLSDPWMSYYGRLPDLPEHVG